MNKRKIRKRKSRLILFIILLIVCAVLYFVLFRTYTAKTSTKIIDSIKGYGYTLEKRDSELMKTTFASLKEELTKDDIDYEKYAKYMSELFIIDLYSIQNKNSRYDIGGTEYVYTDYQDSFKLKVGDTIYRYIDTLKKKEKPLVESIDVDSIEEDTFTYNENEYEAYKVLINWKYVEDLGYDSEGVINIIKDNDKLYIASFSPEVEDE